MVEENKTSGWFICERCHGLGLENGQRCKNCKGQGVGWFGANCWLFVSWPTKWQALKEKLIRQKILSIFNPSIGGNIYIFHAYIFF